MNICSRNQVNQMKENIELKVTDISKQNEENQSCINNRIEELRQEMMNGLVDLRRESQLPLSLCFTAFRDDDYFGKGEENLRFTGCSLNTNDIMDPRQISFHSIKSSFHSEPMEILFERFLLK